MGERRDDCRSGEAEGKVQPHAAFQGGLHLLTAGGRDVSHWTCPVTIRLGQMGPTPTVLFPTMSLTLLAALSCIVLRYAVSGREGVSTWPKFSAKGFV